VVDTMAKFGVYLRRNAIVTFPDSLDEYMGHQINDKKKIKATINNGAGDDEINKEIADLNTRQKEYRAQKKLIEDNINDNTEEEITADHIQVLKERLMKLEFIGSQIKMALSAIENSAQEHQKFIKRSHLQFNPRLAGGTLGSDSTFKPSQRYPTMQRGQRNERKKTMFQPVKNLFNWLGY